MSFSTKTVPYSALLVVLVMALGACSDDSEPSADATIVSDGVAASDVAASDVAASDASGASDMSQGEGAAPWSCAEITECQATCGIDMACIGTCSAKGCTSAQEAAQALQNCSIAKCLADCIGGDSEPCTACVADNCTAELDACNTHSC
ncbi:MAG: hypothetical protein JRH20_24250 [Deltaproteobacteria bacterium]|nr:hypothetical protein [Deltaproteobacteria bacterium]